MAWLGGGIALSVMGSKNLVQAEALEPENEFTDLGLSCSISKVLHTTEYMVYQCVDDCGNNDDSCCEYADFCRDSYQYYFVETAVEGTSDETVYRGYKTDEPRDRMNVACESSEPVTPLFAVNDAIQCWKPTNGPESIPTGFVGYKCYNPQCWKMRDPALEAANHATTAIKMLVVGAIMCVIGGAIFLCWGHCVKHTVQVGCRK
jgi:hypothetical protein